MESARELLLHELRSTYDGLKQLRRRLGSVSNKVSDKDLSSLIDDMVKASDEQAGRLEEAFQLLGEHPERSESSVVKGFLSEFSSFMKEENPKEAAIDVFAAETAGDIAQYMMQTYQSMLQVAERSGMNHSAPKISDVLHDSMREHKKFQKDVQKVTEKLIQELRPA